MGASFRQVVRKALNKEFQWQYLRPATFISTNNKATPLLNSGDSFPIQLLGFSPSPPLPLFRILSVLPSVDSSGILESVPKNNYESISCSHYAALSSSVFIWIMPSRVNLSVYTAKEKRERERATERERERERNRKRQEKAKCKMLIIYT